MRQLFLGVAAVLLTSGALAAETDPLCSPAYFWIWNGRLDAKTLCAQVDDMYAHGLRNICIHPFPKAFRPGRFNSEMEPDYLTEEYLKVYAEVTRHAAELGMHSYLYDEGGWPSGGACGAVARSDPEQRLAQRRLSLDKADGTARVDVVRYDFKGFAPYPSLVEKGTTAKFLELTHERYRATVGEDFGKCVRVAFTDEPNAPTWSSDFAAEFRARKGYDIVPHLTDMLKRRDASDERIAALNIDYREVMGDLLVERYLNPLRDWCRAHGLLSGGHMNGEHKPSWYYCYGHGSILRSLRALDVPGVDVIWRQIYPGDAKTPAEKPPFPRLAASAAHQNGGRFALSESFAIFGDSLTPAQMKWIVDYQLVRGINTFVFGYHFLSYRGQAMTMCEPHGGPVSPYWDFERPYFEYVTRLCRELSRGHSAADVAVLYDERGLWAGGRWTTETERAQFAVAAELDRRQTAFDFVDDRAIANATIDAGALVVGKARYRTIVLPTSRWMAKAAEARLAAFEKAGGRVVRGTDVASVPRTLAISGSGAADLRVLHRVDGERQIFFVHNEALEDRPVEIAFPTKGRVVRFDPESDGWRTVSADGRLLTICGPGETALYAVGCVGGPTHDGPVRAPGRAEAIGPWTLQKLVSHEVGKEDFVIRPCADAPVSVQLGDWRKTLGARFSGRAVYRASFVSAAAGRAQIDLGEVRYVASLKVNGRDLGPRFFGPYRWEADLAAGTNRLEVTVANLLVNQIGHDDVRDRIARDFPPLCVYDERQRAFDRENHESGLYGPVTVRRFSEGK